MPEAYYGPWPEAEDLLIREALDRLVAGRYCGDERLAALALHEWIFEGRLVVAMRCFLKQRCRDVWTLADLRGLENAMASNPDAGEIDAGDFAHVFIRVLAEPGLAADELRQCYNAFHLPQFNREFPMRGSHTAPDPAVVPAAPPSPIEGINEIDLFIEMAAQELRQAAQKQERLTNRILCQRLFGPEDKRIPALKDKRWTVDWTESLFKTKVLKLALERAGIDPAQRQKLGRPPKV